MGKKSKKKKMVLPALGVWQGRGRYSRGRPFLVTGGQTGVDRGAMEAALVLGWPCGGYCPAKRKAEDGRIPAVFPLTPISGGGYSTRTRANARAGDVTVLLYDGKLDGGSETTVRAARKAGSPCVLVDAGALDAVEAARRIKAACRRHRPVLLNVAGPRESEWPGAQTYARRVLTRLFTEIAL